MSESAQKLLAPVIEEYLQQPFIKATVRIEYVDDQQEYNEIRLVIHGGEK